VVSPIQIAQSRILNQLLHEKQEKFIAVREFFSYADHAWHASGDSPCREPQF
jgi:hypothetical protein